MDPDPKAPAAERKGVRITFEVSPDSADRIFALARDGQLDHLGIDEIVVEPSQANPDDQRSWRRNEQLKRDAVTDPGHPRR